MTGAKYCIATKYFVDEIFYQLEMETSGAVPINEQQSGHSQYSGTDTDTLNRKNILEIHRYFEQEKIFQKDTDTLNRKKYSRNTPIR